MAYVTAMEWNIPRTSGLTWWKILSDFLQESPRYTKHPTGDLHFIRTIYGVVLKSTVFGGWDDLADGLA